MTSEIGRRTVLYIYLWCRARRTSLPQDELSPGQRPPLPFSCSVTMAALCALGWRARWSCYTMTSTTIPHWRAHILPPLCLYKSQAYSSHCFLSSTWLLRWASAKSGARIWPGNRRLPTHYGARLVYVQYVRSPERINWFLRRRCSLLLGVTRD